WPSTNYAVGLSTGLFSREHFLMGQGEFPENEVGDVILLTEAGDKSWDTVAHLEFTPRDVLFVNDSLGYLVGSNASILKTTDRGKTWSREYPWPPMESDSDTPFWSISLLPDEKTLIITGRGVLVRGEFDEWVSSVPVE